MSDREFTSSTLSNHAREPQPVLFDSVSESSHMSTVASCKRSRSRRRSRRYVFTEPRLASQSTSKRLKSFYNDNYRAIFNSTVNELAWNKSSMTDHLLQESQIGITVWSSEEKAAFFHALARKGRHNIRGIATDIGTKNESEVYVYSDMLHKATVEQQTYRTRKSLLDTSSLEAALEVQEDCCAALDLAAESLSAFQQYDEEKAAKKKHKDFALLTPRIARWIERRMAVPEGSKEEMIQHIPAAAVLNLVNFLALSKSFFMNSVIAEDNWRSYTGRRTKSPSMTYTAFSDFHTILVSITQRLVQSSLFFAMSRLRAMSSSGHYRPGLHVRRQDVIAALDVLGMKADAKVFWTRTARKCKLRVYDEVRHRQVFGKRYSYTELERILSPSMFSDADSPAMLTKHVSAATSPKGPSARDRSVSTLEGFTSLDSTSVDGFAASALSNDEDVSVTPLHTTTEEDDKHDGHDELQDAYAEVLDQQASVSEGRRLWEMLGKDPAEKMESADVKLPKRPIPNRKPEDELLGWEELVDYAEDWETHETPGFKSIFANDVDSATGSTSYGSSLESVPNDVITEAEHNDVYDKDPNSDCVTTNHFAYASSAGDVDMG